MRFEDLSSRQQERASRLNEKDSDADFISFIFLVYNKMIPTNINQS